MFQLAAFADEADGSLIGQINAMQDNDIPLLEIRGVDGINVSDLSVAQAKEIRKKLEDAEKAVWSIGSPLGKIDITDEFAPHLDKFCHTLEIADILGAKHIRLFSFYHQNVPFSDTLKDTVLERLAQFLEKAKNSDILLCHENEKGIYGDTAERCAELHKALPALKAVFDPANFIQCGQEILSGWDLLEPYIEYLHIKDAMPDGCVVPAGCGIGYIPELLKRYEAIGGCTLTLEPHLTVFDGFSQLEQPGDTTKINNYRYSSGKEAFRAAVVALRNLIG